ncbi:MAG: SMP-30/gluconolactonase/LRE family protein [Planctomycetia bacterium]|nr:SMP-30/gluconolactonase/LRE family protein [Planctomycetia bacterium]
MKQSSLHLKRFIGPNVELLRGAIVAAALVAFLSTFLNTAYGDEPALPSSEVPAAVAPATVAAGAKLQTLFEDKSYYEGPAWDPRSGRLYCTRFMDANTQVLRLDAPGKVTVWMDKTRGVNGLYLGNDGRLLAAQGQAKAILSMKIGADGPEETKVLATSKTWHAPNDLCQTPRGDIYFTDPDFGPMKSSTVYRIDTTGKVTAAVTDMALCNGITASLDGRTLYVGDSNRKHWRSYPIADDGSVGQGKLFFAPQGDNKWDPDGMTVDARGNLYLTGMGRVWAVTPTGKLLGSVPTPEFCSNVRFGGADNKTLYITGQHKIYGLAMAVPGRPSPAPPAIAHK